MRLPTAAEIAAALALVACGGAERAAPATAPGSRSDAIPPPTAVAAPSATPSQVETPPAARSSTPSPPEPTRGSEPDEILHARAYDFARAGDLTNARRAYFDLIKDRPNSRFMPNAYVAFGEMFFEESARDPSKLDLAAQAYTEAIKYPPPGNEVYGYAWYKLAQVHVLKNDDAKALNAFVKVNQAAQATPLGQDLARAAQRDIIAVYARAGKPAAAFEFFTRMTGGTRPLDASKMSHALGVEYFRASKMGEATSLYKDLMARDGRWAACYAAFLSAAQSASAAPGRPAIEWLTDVERSQPPCPR